MTVRPMYAEDTDMAIALTVNQYRPPELTRIIEESNRRFMETVGAVNRAIAEKAMKLYNYFNNNPLIERLKNRLTQSELVLSDNAFHRITPVNIFNPSMIMRRYVMAYPRAYKLYRKDRINAYDGMWEDPEPYFKPHWRTDYLKVIDGVMQYHNDEQGTGYTEHLVGRTNELTFRQQLIVQEAWEIFDNLMARDIDPTDIENYGKTLEGGENGED